MYYQRIGNKNNQSLMLLHSGGMSSKEWQPQLKAFSETFDLLIPDLPGHGKSTIADRKKLSIAFMGEQLIEVLSKENIDKVHVLGSSTGGAVALWLSLNYPNYIDRLIIYRIGYQKTNSEYEYTKLMSDPSYWERYGLHKWLSQLHLAQGGKDAWKNVIASVGVILDPKITDHNHALSDLKKIRAKTLLIAGDRDPLVPLSTLVEMSEMIKDSALWVIPNASHVTATNTWRKQVFSLEIERFLNN